MNETDKEKLEQITHKLTEIAEDHWIDLHHLRFWSSGEKVFVDFHLTIPYYFNIKTSHKEEEKIVTGLNSIFSEAQARIHFDYCYPQLCKYCCYTCEVRQEPKTQSVEWNTEKFIGDPIENKTHDT